MTSELSASVKLAIERGVAVLKGGGLLAFPTDTVYGLGAAANNYKAVARIYEVKERSQNMPLPLLLGSLSQVEEITKRMPPLARCLAERFWPGGLTMVLPRASSVLDIVTAGGSTVGVRVPAHPVPLALINGLGAPVIGTSANLSGKPSAVSAAEIAAQFGNVLDLIIDGGRSYGSRESTIIDATKEVPVVLREGAIPIAELESACGVVFKRLKSVA